jgi:hypothetical protein
MPEASSYIFKHREVVELLIKKAGVHEGNWMLLVTFGFGAGNMGPMPEEMSPGAFVAVTSIGIQQAPPDAPAALTVDAALVNPTA